VAQSLAAKRNWNLLYTCRKQTGLMLENWKRFVVLWSGSQQ
jgi:hypothetical protein